MHGTVFRLDQDVREALIKFCEGERRSLSNAVNVLVIEGLRARGLWPQVTNEPTED